VSSAKLSELRALFAALDVNGDNQLSEADAQLLSVRRKRQRESAGGVALENEGKHSASARMSARMEKIREELLLMVGFDEDATVSFDEYVERLVGFSADFG